MRASWREHRVIYEALRRRDGDAAAELLRQQKERECAWLLEHVELNQAELENSNGRSHMKAAAYDQLRSTPVREGVSRKVFSGEGATLAWTTLEPGHEPRPHAHHYEQIVYIVSGRVRFTVGDDARELGPGDVLLVPPGVEHFAETIGDQPAVDLSIFTPRRDEYAAEESIG